MILIYTGLFLALLATLFFFVIKSLLRKRKLNRELKTRFILANLKHKT